MSEARLWPAPYADTLAAQEAADRQRIHARYQAAGNHGLAVRLAELSGTYPSLGGGPLLGAALAGLEPEDPRMAQLAIHHTRLDAEALDGLRATTLETVGNHGGSIWSIPFDVFKGATRSLFLGFDFLWEELLMRPLRTAVGALGQGMSWEDAYGAAGASTALRALQTALKDPWGSFTPAASRPDAQVNVGSGFFWGSTLSPETTEALGRGVPIEQAARNPAQELLGAPISQITKQQRETGIMLTSHGGVKVPVSPGRLLAINFTEPGSTAFGVLSGLTDLSANIFLDPSNLAFGWISDARKAMSALTPGQLPGLVAGAERATIIPGSLADVLYKPAGVDFTQKLATNNVGMDTILRMLKSTQGYVPPEVADDIYKATRTGDPAKVRDAFLAHEPKFHQTPYRSTMLGRTFNTRSGSLFGAPLSSAIGRYGVPTVAQAGLGAAGGAFTAALAGQDPVKGAAIGGAAGLGLSAAGVTRLAGGGDAGALIARTQSLGLAVRHNARKADSYLAWLATSVGAHGYSVRDKPRTLEDFSDNLMLMRLPDATRDELLVRMVRAKGMPEVYGVVRDSYQKWADQLVEEGIERTVADSIVRLYKKDWTDFRAYWVNKAGQAQYAPGVILKMGLDGKAMPQSSAFLMSELVDQWVPILDPKVVRAALRRVNKHSIISRSEFTDWDRLGDRVITRVADSFMTKVWKPLVLLRVAWPVRVITEEQVRMAALGLNSSFRHPIQYLAQMLAGSESKFADTILGAGRTKARDAEGTLMRLSDEQAAVRSRREDWTGGIDVRDPHTGEHRVVSWGDPDFQPANVNRVSLLSRDPLVPYIAEAARAHRRAGGSLHGEPRFLDEVKRRFVEDDLAHLRWEVANDGGRHGYLVDRAGAEAHVDYVWGQMVASQGADAYFLEGYGVFPNTTFSTVPGTGEVVGLPGPAGTTIHGGKGWRNVRAEPVPLRLVDQASGRPERGFMSAAPAPVRTMPAHISQAYDDATMAVDAAVNRYLQDPTLTREQLQMGFTTDSSLLRWYASDAGLPDAGEIDDILGSMSNELDDLLTMMEEQARLASQPPNARTPASVAEARMDRLNDDIEELTAELEAEAADLLGRLNRSPSQGTMGMRQATEEFIPQMEARRLAMFEDREFEEIFHSFDDHPRFVPVNLGSRGMPDGVYRFQEGLSGRAAFGAPTPLSDSLSIGEHGSVVIVRDNHAVAQMYYQVTGTGTNRAIRVNTLKSAPVGHPLGRPSDASRMVDEMMKAENIPPEGRLSLVLGAHPDSPTVGEWLRNEAAISGRDLGEITSTEGLIKAIRESREGFTGINRPYGAETLSREGARFAGSRIRRSARGGTGAGDVSNWPQHRPYVVVPANQPEISDEVLNLWADDVWRFTGSDGTIIERPNMFRDGPNGERPWMAREKRDHSSRKDEFGRQYLSHVDERMVGPDGRRLFRETQVSAPVRQGKAAEGSWDRAIDFMFDLLMGKRTDVLSRSPAFSQFYWKRMARLIPYLEPEDARKALAQLREMNPRTFTEWGQDLLKGDDGTLNLLNRLADNSIDHTAFLKQLDSAAAGSGRISLADADEWAKGYALTETRDLLYDISRKHNAFDMARHIFPFGEAWLEIITRWGGIVRDNPAVLRRLDQTISSARDSGFFYNDETTGEEVFAYPGSGLISKWMFDDPSAVRFTGRVAGMNLMLGQFMPGFGPVVQMPASMLARDFLEHPDNKFLREMLLPFGFQDADTPGEAIDALLPTWIRRLATAWEHPTGDDQRIFNNTVIDIMRILVDTGQADIGTKEGYDAAYALAVSKAKGIYAVRAASALMGPTPAGPRFYREDRNGRLWSFTALSDEYHKLVEENQGSEYMATQQFTQLFGMDPSLYVTPKTRSLVRRSTTESGAAFQARNPELFHLAPLTAYYARPDDLDEEFDYNAYVSQLRERTREPLDPKQWALERNNLLGRMAYHHARVMMGDARNTAAGKQQLSDYRQMLMNRYQGYNSPVIGVPQRANRDALIREFLTWEQSPALMETDAGQGLAMYVRARQQVLDRLAEMGLGEQALQTSKKALIYRDWLRAVSQQIIALHPSFLTQWTEVWAHEVEETDLEAERQLILEGVGF